MGKSRFSISGKLVGAFLAIAVVQLVFCLYAIRQLGTVGGHFDAAQTDAVRPFTM